jgi:flagellar protein FliS
MYGQKAAAYRDAEILGTSREQLVPLLYRHLLIYLRKGAQQIQERDLEGKAESLSRASDILYELLGSLDPDQGGELADRLAGLYSYFLNEIREAGRTLDAGRLSRMISLVDSLHEAWAQAARTVEGERRAGRGSGGAISV